MKKLSLKKLNFGADDLLQREQLKSVLGGYNNNSGQYQIVCIGADSVPVGYMCVSECPTDDGLECCQQYSSSTVSSTCNYNSACS